MSPHDLKLVLWFKTRFKSNFVFSTKLVLKLREVNLVKKSLWESSYLSFTVTRSKIGSIENNTKKTTSKLHKKSFPSPRKPLGLVIEKLLNFIFNWFLGNGIHPIGLPEGEILAIDIEKNLF